MNDRFFALWADAMPTSAAGKWLTPNSEPSRADKEGLAILEISGTLVQRVSWFDFGTTVSLTRIADELNSLRLDDSVTRVLISFDSPGGTVAGTNAAANALKQLAAAKPSVVFVPSLCASGALWICSAATKIFADETAIIGSIGCFNVLADFSKMFSRAGIDVTLITSGGVKGHGALGTPVTDELKTSVQEMVDNIAAKFITAVATNRKLRPEYVSAMADGSVVMGDIAKGIKLIDEVGSIESAKAALMKMPAKETPDAFAMRSYGPASSSTFGLVELEYKQLRQRFGDRVAEVCPRFTAHYEQLKMQASPPFKPEPYNGKFR